MGTVHVFPVTDAHGIPAKKGVFQAIEEGEMAALDAQGPPAPVPIARL